MRKKPSKLRMFVSAIPSLFRLIMNAEQIIRGRKKGKQKSDWVNEQLDTMLPDLEERWPGRAAEVSENLRSMVPDLVTVFNKFGVLDQEEAKTTTKKTKSSKETKEQ